jgi:hypothetical protein
VWSSHVASRLADVATVSQPAETVKRRPRAVRQSTLRHARGLEQHREGGVPDATDRCGSTPTGRTVDPSGCTLEEFCAAVDATTSRGAKLCRNSDWGNDEPLMKHAEADCRVAGRRRAARCVGGAGS